MNHDAQRVTVIVILFVAMVLLAGCQSISVTADNGASVRIEGSNSKPIDIAAKAAAGDSAIKAGAAAMSPVPAIK